MPKQHKLGCGGGVDKAKFETAVHFKVGHANNKISAP